MNALPPDAGDDEAAGVGDAELDGVATGVADADCDTAVVAKTNIVKVIRANFFIDWCRTQQVENTNPAAVTTTAAMLSENYRLKRSPCSEWPGSFREWRGETAKS